MPLDIQVFRTRSEEETYDLGKKLSKELKPGDTISLEGDLGTGKTAFKIVFPLLKPTTMTIIILDILWIWNDYLLPSLILIAPESRTLPLTTFYFYGTYSVSHNLLMAGLMLTILPVIIIYLFMQKQIISGIVQGSIK